MEPNWKPLEEKLGRTRCVGFMFMGRVNGVNQYKHGISRTYLNLDDAGNCYVRTESGGYIPAEWGKELAQLEACLAALGASLVTPYDEEFIARKRKALQQDGIRLRTIQVELQDVKIH